jgi:hypothetical protein
MAELDLNTAWEDIEDQPDFGLVPTAKYVLEIVNSDIKPTKAEDGRYINFEIKICDGEYVNRRIFEMVHIENTSEKAVARGLSTLKKICAAVGMPGKLPRDTEQLHGIQFLGLVGIKKGDGNYEDKNCIKTWEQLEDRVPTPAKTHVNPSAPARALSQLSRTLDDDVPF